MHNFVRIAARVRERHTDDAAGVRLPATRWKLGRQQAARGRNRSAERIGTKFGVYLRTTGFQWPAKFYWNQLSRFETADYARNPLPATNYRKRYR